MKAAVVGAGVIGKLLAFRLVNAGWNVTLFEKEADNHAASCSMAAAGLLTPITELEKSDSLIYELGKAALTKHWPNILQQLDEVVYFQNQGSLVLAHPRDNTEMTRFINTISDRVPDQAIYEKLTQADIVKLEPAITKFENGYFLPMEGQLDNQSLLKSVSRYLQHHQVEFRENFLVDDINNLVNTSFDITFDCRGLGAKSVFNDLRGIRGELIWIHAPDVDIHRPIRLMHPRYNLYIAPRPGNMYILGASEIESEEVSHISVRTMLELLSSAYYLHPGFAEAKVVKTLTQCRPTLTDHLPKIKYADGVVAINGLYRHGFLIAPTLVDDICRWLENGIRSVHYPQVWEQMA
jgi:glycine oxidase